jgi:cytosine/adenosine deaminase-related metal-dependent hydrolase
VARVVALIPDLLFGSNVQGALSAAGHEVELVGRLEPGLNADVLVVDLTADPTERVEQVKRARPEGVPVLAFYSHVETDVRELAEAAGFELVVPRSRMAREGAALVERLSA